MAFRLGIADTIKIVPPAIKGQFQDIVKGMNSDTFFADDSCCLLYTSDAADE